MVFYLLRLFTRKGDKRERGGGGEGRGGGKANPLICIEIGLSAHFLCARGFLFSQVMYKSIIGF